MDFVKKYVFCNPNIEDIDDIIGKANFDCLYRCICSYNFSV